MSEIAMTEFILFGGVDIMIEEIECRFTYHAPKPGLGQQEKYQEIRDLAKKLAYMIEFDCIESREKALAMTRLEEAVMWANASIARRS